MFSLYLFFISLFFVGLFGFFLTKKHVILILIAIELVLLAANLLVCVFSLLLDDLFGQMFALIILTIAAAESAIGLAILLINFRLRGSVFISFLNLLKG